MKDSGLTPERLAAEAAIFAERSNLTEETVRLDSHFKQARSCLEASEPVGRKLDFIVQEMNREINTIVCLSITILIQCSASILTPIKTRTIAINIATRAYSIIVCPFSLRRE